jgi:MinD-like ATPase involved in chromosome partitioning or flagellar assembly
MVLANVAVQLARMGNNVLVVDWDPEAPGLERYFTNSGQNSGAQIQALPAVNPTGLMGLLREASDRGDAISAEQDWRDRLVVVEVPQAQPARTMQTPTRPTPIHFLPSGYKSEDYAKELSEFSWSTFFADSRGGEWLEALRDQWSVSYDFVLIDSRTGLTDSGGVCTIQMPHMLVLVFTANDQSVEGGLRVVAAAQRERRDFGYDRGPLVVIPVLSRWEGEKEVDIGEQWMKRFDSDLAPLTAPWLPKDFSPRQFLEKTRVPHVPRFTFGEPLPVLTHSLSDPGLPGLYFDTIAQLIQSQLSNVGTVIDPTYIDEQYRRAPTGAVEVFISYRASDDTPPPDSPNSYGFVSYLMRQLRYELTQLGIVNPVFWVDRAKIQPGDSWSERISFALKKAEFFIVILSRNYITSSWVAKELSTMASRVANLNPQLHRIFRVDRQWIPEDKIPAPLHKVQSVRFYHRDHREYFYRGKVRHPKEYEEAVRTLALGIDEQLNKLRNEAGHKT